MSTIKQTDLLNGRMPSDEEVARIIARARQMRADYLTAIFRGAARRMRGLVVRRPATQVAETA